MIDDRFFVDNEIRFGDMLDGPRLDGPLLYCCVSRIGGSPFLIYKLEGRVYNALDDTLLSKKDISMYARVGKGLFVTRTVWNTKFIRLRAISHGKYFFRFLKYLKEEWGYSTGEVKKNVLVRLPLSKTGEIDIWCSTDSLDWVTEAESDFSKYKYVKVK